jgi:hypothetical protein
MPKLADITRWVMGLPMIDVIAMAGSLVWLMGGAIGAWAGVMALDVLRDLAKLVVAVGYACGAPIR